MESPFFEPLIDHGRDGRFLHTGLQFNQLSVKITIKEFFFLQQCRLLRLFSERSFERLGGSFVQDYDKFERLELDSETAAQLESLSLGQYTK